MEKNANQAGRHSAGFRAVAELFEAMDARRRVLEGVVAYCQQPRPMADVNREVDRLQAHDASVFTGPALAAMLEKAGAIERVGWDGPVEPRRVEESGVAYWEPQVLGPQAWQATEAGLTMLCDEGAARERLAARIVDNPRYASAYLRLVELCAADGGATPAQAAAELEGDEALTEPKRLATSFLDELDAWGAIAWEGAAWCATDLGRAVWTMLAGSPANARPTGAPVGQPAGATPADQPATAED